MHKTVKNETFSFDGKFLFSVRLFECRTFLSPMIFFIIFTFDGFYLPAIINI